jgi:predicted ATPase
MRIGLSGAQSTGKTTLLNALRSEPFFKTYDVCSEVTRKVASYGLPINEEGTDTTQELIMNQHIVNLSMHNHMITDRTVLDGYVYSRYLRENGKIKSDTMDYVETVFNRMISGYDMIFYIAPEFEIKNDGVRSINTFFRERIVNIFDEAITRFEIPVYRVKGTVRERVQFVLNAVEINMEMNNI